MSQALRISDRDRLRSRLPFRTLSLLRSNPSYVTTAEPYAVGIEIERSP